MTNFESKYLSDGYADSVNILNGLCPTSRDFLQQTWFGSIQVLLSYRCMKTVFSWFLYICQVP